MSSRYTFHEKELEIYPPNTINIQYPMISIGAIYLRFVGKSRVKFNDKSYELTSIIITKDNEVIENPAFPCHIRVPFVPFKTKFSEVNSGK